MKEYMENISVKEAIAAGRIDTLCWDCQNAMNGGCCWSDPAQQKPVCGWTADETENGCRVISCPEFIRETYGGGRYRTADDYILALETLATTQANQIKNLKKNIWWKHVYRLNSQKKQLQLRIKQLGEIIEEMKKGGMKNGTEKDDA